MYVYAYKILQGISKFAELILIILLKCFEIIPQGLLCPGVLEQFCVEEKFLFRISAKPLLAAFSEQKSFNVKLVELLESEALSMLTLLQTSSKYPKKMNPVCSSISDYVVLHVSFPEVEFIISNFLKGNPANQKVFYNCCIHKAIDVLNSTDSSIQPRVENLIALILGEITPEIIIDKLSKTDLNSKQLSIGITIIIVGYTTNNPSAYITT